MSVPYSSRMFHDEPISDSNQSGDALDDNWADDGQDADVSIPLNYLLFNIITAVIVPRRRRDDLNVYISIPQLFDLIPMHSEVGMVTSAPMVRRMRRFVPHAGLKHAAASELLPMPELSPGNGSNSGIHELNKRLTDMKFPSNQDSMRRESTFSNYWSMKSEYSRRNSQVRTAPAHADRICLIT